MNNTLVKAGIIGGLIVFLWGVFSWMVLPWHAMTTDKFVDEQAVARVIEENAPESGIYVLPCLFASKFEGNRDEVQKQMQMGRQMMKNGPFVFAAVSLGGGQGLSVSHFIVAILTQIVAAALITWMIVQTKLTNYMEKVWFITVVGLVVGLLAFIPAWNWMHFSPTYTFVSIVDMTIGWFLGGLGMAKLINEKKKR